ncbi:MAG: DUF488 family protein [Nitrospinota bacterium]
MGDCRAEGLRVFTVGHSTRPIEEFLRVLRAHGIDCLVDVRSYPQSRRHPHFERESLRASLEGAGIRYTWMKALGGRRRLKGSKVKASGKGHPSDESAPGASLHSGIPSEGFRAYIEHLATPQASQAIDRIVALARMSRVALMCAERNFRLCHRQFLADRLKSLGAKVFHIEDVSPPEEHTCHPSLQVRGGDLRYPPKEMELPLV